MAEPQPATQTRSIALRSYIADVCRLDVRSLAIFRIALSVVVLVDLLERIRVFEVMFTDQGLMPLSDLRELFGRDVLSSRHFSLHMLHSSSVFQAGMFLLAGVFAVLLCLGWKSRLAAVVTFLLHLSLQTRSPLYGSGESTMLGVLLFWSMFLPLGHCLSIDQKKRRGRMPEHTITMWTGQAGYLIHLCLIYLCAAYAKGAQWRDGGALQDIMHVEMVASEFGHSLTQYPALLRFLTSSVFYIEAIGPFLLFLPFFRVTARGLCVLLFVGLHAGIAATCDIGLFPYVSIVLWVPLIPGVAWSWFGGRSSSELDESSLFEAGALSTASPLQNGRLVAGVSIVLVLAAQLLVLGSAVLYAAPGLRRICEVPAVRKVVHSTLSLTKLQQSWGVFKFDDDPPDGWFVVEGTLGDGSKVDILRGMVPVDWSKPPLSGPRRLHVVWRTYLNRQELSGGHNLTRFAAWLNLDFRRTQRDKRGFDQIRIVYMLEPPPSAADQSVSEVVLWSGRPG